MKLIDKSALVAEIERRKQKLLDHIICERDKEFACRAAHQLNRIIDFIDTLEVKELDFEKEAEQFVQSEKFIYNKESPVLLIAKHFYELGLKAQKGE